MKHRSRNAYKHRIFRFATLPCLTLLQVSACAPSASQDPEGEAAVGIQALPLRNCPPTDPDYPSCTVPPVTCEGATGRVGATRDSILLGQSITINWSATLPAECTDRLTLNQKGARTSGSEVVTPMSDTEYTLRVGKQGLASKLIRVVLPSTVQIEGGSAPWVALMKQALATPNTRVVLGKNVDMDLTGHSNIQVARGVTFESEAPPIVIAGNQLLAAASPIFDRPVARNGTVLGPRLYTNSHPNPLFILPHASADYSSDNIRIAGFRIQGPRGDIDGDDALEVGIEVASALGVDIDTMEVSGFSGSAIRVSDDGGYQLGPSAVRIHDSFIHNNQHSADFVRGGGYGYGVDVGASAYARIERNVFDFNRHAITANGRAGTGYEANRNLILRGGGYHGSAINEYTHIVDVHGDANPPLPFLDHVWDRGNAGDQFWITNNAFQYVNDYAIKIRGTPRIGISIANNIFAQSDAIALNQGRTRIDVSPNNTYDKDTFGTYGVCDFDGDGKDDLLLATGVSWWMMSAGKLHWNYVSDNTETRAQIGFGDFNGDGRCDVIRRNPTNGVGEIASGARGSWRSIDVSFASIAFDQLRFGDFNGDKTTDIFQRAANGQWSVISPGHYPWTPMLQSSLPIDRLRFGDFNGDGVTDVLANVGGSLAISWSGRTGFQPTGAGQTDDVRNLYIANVDGIVGDDLVRYDVTSPTDGHWDISSTAGRPWKLLASRSWPNTEENRRSYPSIRIVTYLGRFTPPSYGANLMFFDGTERVGMILDRATKTFAQHSLYSY
jgi:hypothetical protein